MNLPDKIERDLFLPVTIERVWQAVSTPTGLSNWFSDHTYFKETVGETIKFVWDEYGTVYGRIEQIDPPHTFAYRWRAHGIPETEPMQPNNSTLVTFSLTEVKGGTQLQVLETGFAGLDTAVQETSYKENTSGWQAELQELVDYLTSVAA